jgi:hypothetical protein
VPEQDLALDPTSVTTRRVRGLVSPFGFTVLGIAQLEDLVTFLIMVRLLGPGAELNPLALELHDGGLLMVLAAKLTVWALVAAIAATIAPTRPGLARFVVGFGILVGLLGAFSNLLTAL